MALSEKDKELLAKLEARFADWNTDVEYVEPVPAAAEPEVIELDCQYCGRPTQKVTGDVIYPYMPKLHSKWYYLCAPCNAYVGCHEDGRPYGDVADKLLRTARINAHKAFDPLWKTGSLTRSQAYSWLSQELGIPARECHIGKFNLSMCLKATRICRKYIMKSRS